MGLSERDTIEIDNQGYDVVGTVRFVRHVSNGRHANTDSRTLYGLRRHHDSAHLYLECHDGYRLFQACERDDVSALPVEPSVEHRPFQIDDDVFADFYAEKGATMIWGIVEDGAFADQAPAPFTGSPDVLAFTPAGVVNDEPTALFYSRRLSWTDDKKSFYTTAFPTSRLERDEVELIDLPVSWLPINLGLMLLCTLLGFDQLSSSSFVQMNVTQVFWSVGLIALFGRLAGRGMRVYPLAHMLSTALFLWMCTRFAHNQLIGLSIVDDVARLEVAHMTASLGVLTILRLLSHRGYFILAEAAFIAGISGLIAYSIAYTIASWVAGFAWIHWYTWYLGHSVWGVVWFLYLTVWLVIQYSSLHRVPLTFRAFERQLEQVRTLLADDIDEVCRRVRVIERLISNLAGAVQISDDPRVARLGHYEHQLTDIALGWQGARTKGLSPDRDRTLLEQDMVLLRDELLELLTPPDGPVGASIRLSPRLGALRSY